MSRRNGDRARFNKDRKKKIARRAASRELRAAAMSASGAAAKSAKV